MKRADKASYYTKDSGVKLVPIDARAAGDCARHGKQSGRGYYKTVNDRVRAAERLFTALDYLLAQTVNHGIMLTEGETEAREMALAAIADYKGVEV